MSLSIPKEQKHGVETPVMLPFYQYVKLSPMGNVTPFQLNNNNYSDEIRWELSGDNIINLAKSYIQYDIVVNTTVIPANTPNANVANGFTGNPNAIAVQTYPNVLTGIKEGFGLASFRICNQTGTDLVRLDDSYEPYRIFMDEIVRKRPDQYYNDNFYDGIQLAWNNNVKDKEIVSEYSKYPDYLVNHIGGGNAGEYVLDNFQHNVIHVKIPLGRFYNTFAAMKSDLFFAERMYICIRFQTLNNFGVLRSYCHKEIYDNAGNVVPDHFFDTAAQNEVFTLENFKFYAYYNKDSQCNNNTKNFCLSKPIQFNDFRCHQVTCTSPTGKFNYSFTLNSSNGPFLRFIIYRQYDLTNNRWCEIPMTSQFRWMINDFVHQPDYANMQYDDSYMMVQDYFKDSWFDVFRQHQRFNHKFFEILNFGSRDLDNIKNQAGRPLATDLKITFDFDCGGDAAWPRLNISHRFYIITGRLCTINGSGIVSVV